MSRSSFCEQMFELSLFTVSSDSQQCFMKSSVVTSEGSSAVIIRLREVLWTLLKSQIMGLHF